MLIHAAVEQIVYLSDESYVVKQKWWEVEEFKSLFSPFFCDNFAKYKSLTKILANGELS